MFEKKAEEYQIKMHHKRLYGKIPVVMKELNTAFKDGYTKGYDDGYRSAMTNGNLVVRGSDEWHYLSKCEYPPLGTDVLVCIKLLTNNKAIKIGSFQSDGGLLIEGFICSTDAVIAWQPLPGLPMEG